VKQYLKPYTYNQLKHYFRRFIAYGL